MACSIHHVTIDPPILYIGYVGTPVVLVSTRNEDDSVNLAPISSAWALGKSIVLGFDTSGQTAGNLARTGECVLNLPSDGLWPAVERLAPLTGATPVPERKVSQGFRHEDRFGAAGSPILTDLGSPPGVAGCGITF